MRRRALVTAAGLALAWTGAASAQQKRPLAAEDLYRLRFASNVTVSPDGRWAAYVVSGADSAKSRYEQELWLAAADGSSRRQLTYAAGDGAGSPATGAPSSPACASASTPRTARLANSRLRDCALSATQS